MNWFAIFAVTVLVIIPFVFIQFSVLGWQGVVVILGWLTIAGYFHWYNAGFWIAIVLYLGIFLSRSLKSKLGPEIHRGDPDAFGDGR